MQTVKTLMCILITYMLINSLMMSDSVRFWGRVVNPWKTLMKMINRMPEVSPAHRGENLQNVSVQRVSINN